MRKFLASLFVILFALATGLPAFAADGQKSEGTTTAAPAKVDKAKPAAKSEKPKAAKPKTEKGKAAKSKADKDKKAEKAKPKAKPGKPELQRGVLGTSAKRWADDQPKKAEPKKK